MPRHGCRLQLDGSELLTPGEHNHLDHFLRTAFADLSETEHLPANNSRLSLGIYVEDIQILKDMLKDLCFCFDYKEDEDMFEEYKAGEHCSRHSSPEAQDALMERSGGHVFFFGPVYSLGVHGRRWAYKCELEDMLQTYEDRLCAYRKYVDGLTTATI